MRFIIRHTGTSQGVTDCGSGSTRGSRVGFGALAETFLIEIRKVCDREGASASTRGRVRSPEPSAEGGSIAPTKSVSSAISAVLGLREISTLLKTTIS